jgi:hypothetical protein
MLEHRLPFVAVVLSLAYIGSASRRRVWPATVLTARRFRLGDKKEGAGAGVAVMVTGIMEIECGLVIGESHFGRRWRAPAGMAVKHFEEPSAAEPFREVG